MDWLFIILFLLTFLLCVIGTVYFFYRAIRLLIYRKIRKGIIRLILSLLLGFLVFLAIFAFIGATEYGHRKRCRNNLGQVMLLIKHYASYYSYDSHYSKVYPSTFNRLVNDSDPYSCTDDNKYLFICPSSHHTVGSLTNIQDWTDYAYVSGLSEADPTGCVVAFCLPEYHLGQGANVAFIDGRVQWVSCKDFHDLTNAPSLFYGTTNEVLLAELMKRTKIIYPKKRK